MRRQKNLVALLTQLKKKASPSGLDSIGFVRSPSLNFFNLGRKSLGMDDPMIYFGSSCSQFNCSFLSTFPEVSRLWFSTWLLIGSSFSQLNCSFLSTFPEVTQLWFFTQQVQPIPGLYSISLKKKSTWLHNCLLLHFGGFLTILLLGLYYKRSDPLCVCVCVCFFFLFPFV